jgi:hypothetical protein
MRVLLFFLLSALLLPAQETRFDRDSRTMGLVGGWGHSWKGGWPGFGRTETGIAFGAFHPQMGWFVSDRLELYGEGTLLVYHKPKADIAGGLLGLAGRYHFWNDRFWTPYVTLGGGLLWTSQQDVKEIDRIFNFQVVAGVGVRFVPRKGPGWIIEFRNHHISNAGTAGENLGINAATVVAGVQWVLR